MISHSDRIAEELKRQSPGIDDLTRLRMERGLVEAWIARRAAARARVHEKGQRRTSGSRVWVASGTGFAIAAALVVAYGIHRGGPDSGAEPVRVAHFQLRIGDEAVQSGLVAEGQTLESGEYGRITVSAGASSVVVAPESRVRFERMSQEELALSLVQGRVDVTFRPIRPGEQQLTVDTQVARVLAIGTEFSVAVGPSEVTTVSVREGAVRVFPRAGGSTHMVAAGEQVRVKRDGVDAYLPTVRQLLAEKGSAAGSVEPVDDVPDSQAVEPSGAALLKPSKTAAKKAARRVRRTGVRKAQRPAKTPTPEATTPAAVQMSPESLLQAARTLVANREFARARDELRELLGIAVQTGVRVRALVLMAESYAEERQVSKAVGFYREAVAAGPGHPAALRAQLALARLLAQEAKDAKGAKAAYRRYLLEAPEGDSRVKALQALCGMGDQAACGELAPAPE